MPSITLPSLTRAEVEAHKSEKSCYVTIGDKVYDVTDFLDDHPGGPELVLDYAGKDIEAVLKDESSHAHSEAAYEVLDESLVGFLISEKTANGVANGTTTKIEGPAGETATTHPRTGMSCEEDLTKDTDYSHDYKKHKFLDLNKPLFKQVFFGGFSKEFYLDQVHRPRHYKGGKSAPLFGNFLEPLTMTPWYVIPIMWWPCIAYGTFRASQGLSGPMVAGSWGLGLFLWTLVEYLMHRFLFHLDQ